MNKINDFQKNIIKKAIKNRSKKVLSKKSKLLSGLSIAIAQGFVSISCLALPSDGQVASGQAAISQAGHQMTINQASNQAIINWQSFNIGNQESVNFVQPSSTSVILNRVVGSNPSSIFGNMNANGRVMLINTNGIMFGPSARVDVGGLVASTLPITDEKFLNNHWNFSKEGTTSAVLNQGELKAKDGGFIALLGAQVMNQGVIKARLGSVDLVAGDQIQLNFSEDNLLSVSIDKGTFNALVDNQQLIQADGGFVFLSAQAINDLSQAVVNHTGLIEAKTIENKSGKVYLLADMKNGTARINGVIDASAPTGGDGGFVETSGAHVKIGDQTRVKTLANNGKNGEWLIDPQDFYVSLIGGDITGITLSNNLNLGDVNILSENGSTSGTGNIYVNAPIQWTANTILTLDAMNEIFINADIKATGYSAGLKILPMSGIDWREAPRYYHLGNDAKITLSGEEASLKIGEYSGYGYDHSYYRLIHNIDQLQDLAYEDYLWGTYALAEDIDASATADWDWESGAGFRPIGGYDGQMSFKGIFDGLGHTIKNLNIYKSNPYSYYYSYDPEENEYTYLGYAYNQYIGLFGKTKYATIQNTKLVNADIQGYERVGALIGQAYESTIKNNYVFNSSVYGAYNGYSGEQRTSYSYYYAGEPGVGGLIGNALYSTVDNNYVETNSTGVVGFSNTGGLIGYAYNSYITHNYVTGKVDVPYTGYPCEGETCVSINSFSSSFSNLGTIAGLVGLFEIGSNSCKGDCESPDALLAQNYSSARVPTGSQEGYYYPVQSGALIGYYSDIEGLNPSDLNSNYWDVQTSGTTFSKVGMYVFDPDNEVSQFVEVPVGTAVPTLAQMQQESTFSGWDFNNTWFMYEGHTAPLLRSFMKPLVVNVGPAGATYETPYNLDPINYALIFGTLQIAPTPSGLWSNQQGYIISYNTAPLANATGVHYANAVGGCSSNWIDPEMAEALQNMPLLPETFNQPGYQSQYNSGQVRLLIDGSYQGVSQTASNNSTGCNSYFVISGI